MCCLLIEAGKVPLIPETQTAHREAVCADMADRTDNIEEGLKDFKEKENKTKTNLS